LKKSKSFFVVIFKLNDDPSTMFIVLPSLFIKLDSSVPQKLCFAANDIAFIKSLYLNIWGV